tara:strand:+ start:4621 stop:5052 length:432 start_codon:yes stop_codon:yes gene_type:complete
MSELWEGESCYGSNDEDDDWMVDDDIDEWRSVESNKTHWWFERWRRKVEQETTPRKIGREYEPSRTTLVVGCCRWCCSWQPLWLPAPFQLYLGKAHAAMQKNKNMRANAEDVEGMIWTARTGGSEEVRNVVEVPSRGRLLLRR